MYSSSCTFWILLDKLRIFLKFSLIIIIVVIWVEGVLEWRMEKNEKASTEIGLKGFYFSGNENINLIIKERNTKLRKIYII